MASLHVEVVCAWPGGAEIVALELAAGATVRDALDASGLCARHPALCAGNAAVGVYGCIVAPAHRLEDGDRVELYRVLNADPKEARRRRAGRRPRSRPPRA